MKYDTNFINAVFTIKTDLLVEAKNHDVQGLAVVVLIFLNLSLEPFFSECGKKVC